MGLAPFSRELSIWFGGGSKTGSVHRCLQPSPVILIRHHSVELDLLNNSVFEVPIWFWFCLGKVSV